jgi:hypothetical protein
VSIEILYNRTDISKHRLVDRYLRYIASRPNQKIKGVTHWHHILPKAKDMFPEYKLLKVFPWNGVHLTPREHFLAHWMLSKIFPGTSQTRAFYHMTNVMQRKKSKDYELLKMCQIEHSKVVNVDPERRLKISNALKGKPKSKEHIEKLIGHEVKDETRQKLRRANLGKRASVESRKKMSLSRTGKSKTKLTVASKRNIAAAKMAFSISTPVGVFETFIDAAAALNVELSYIKNIFRKDAYKTVPRKHKLEKIGVTYVKGYTWIDYGFYPV